MNNIEITNLKYTLEADVDDYVKNQLLSLGLKKLKDFNEKSSMSEYLKDALKGSAKTKNKTNFGIPDFHIEKYKIPIIIENKLGNKYHIAQSKSGVKCDENSIKNYAVNGAVYYAQNMIASKKYDEVIAIGISGDSDESITISVYYVFSSSLEPKHIKQVTTLDFLQNEKSFDAFYKMVTITEEERHKILIKSRAEIVKHAKSLNKLMNNNNIGIEQRVVYVSGMLLAMQDVYDKNGNIIDNGLVPDDLKGIQTEQKRDSVIIVKHLEEYLDTKDIQHNKKDIMINSFKMAISLDSARDIPKELDKSLGKLLKEEASITKQIFVYLYENVYLAIDMTSGALDIMAEMYSTFLKYALSDGASLGKVLTPPYITTLMAKILDVNESSKVMDLATGSAAFLVAAMDLMINDANKTFGKNTEKANTLIDKIKKNQLLGIEIDAKMYTLAATNMILRGDGSSNIKKADSFKEPEELYKNFGADTLLLNPPFSHEDCGLPFFKFGLDNMKKGGKGAVIIQDVVGAGKATNTTKEILKSHKMLASIKMPADLFEPNATVQTSIYIFESGTPHNFDYDIVKFIDFSNDGYKRTERVISEIDSPIERYSDLYLIYKLGFNAVDNHNFHKNLWDLNKVYCEGTITDKGNDWNFEHHVKYDTSLSINKFEQIINEHLAWNIKNKIHNAETSRHYSPISKSMKSFPIDKIFRIEKTKSYNKGDINASNNTYDYITRSVENRCITDTTGFIDDAGLNSAGTFSLELMNMTFVYRERPWYAGQFIRRIVCKDEIDVYAGLYLEIALKTISKILSSKLIRDVDDVFYSLELELPEKDGEIDYKFMSEYIKNRQNELFQQISL